MNKKCECGCIMNRIEKKENDVLVQIKYRCSNLDCGKIETIERNSYALKQQLLHAKNIIPQLSDNIYFLIDRL